MRHRPLLAAMILAGLAVAGAVALARAVSPDNLTAMVSGSMGMVIAVTASWWFLWR
jgi:hypothetical protein